MWTSSYTENLTDGCWSPTRPSVLLLTRQAGYLDAWDVLYQQKDPLLSFKVSDSPLSCVKVQTEGLLVGVGAEDGNVSMMELSASLSQVSR